MRAEAAEIYSDLGLTLLLGGLREISAQIELLAGDPVAAERELRTAIELLAAWDTALEKGWLAAVLVDQGRHEEARAAAELARDTASADVLTEVAWRGALARVEAAAGNLDLALTLAREGADMAALTDGLAMRAETLLDLAAVLASAEETEAAARATREAVGLYEQKGRVYSAANEALGSLKPR